MSQQTDEGYSEDPLNNASDTSAYTAHYKLGDGESGSTSPPSSAAQVMTLISSHIANLPVELRMRT